MLGVNEDNETATEDMFVLPPSEPTSSKRSLATKGGRVSDAAPTPLGPPNHKNSTSLLNSEPQIGLDESYGQDEKELNSFLRLHPLLSLEACGQKTLDLVSNAFDKALIKIPDVPIIPKSYDDSMLRPADNQIGERSCVSGDACICAHLARTQHGSDTDLAFVCTEFLLPEERAAFLSGSGLPPRRKKCLICTRYFMSYLYFQARTNPNFRVSQAPLSIQCFGNVVGGIVPSTAQQPDLAELGKSMAELPGSASLVSSKDGYLPSAMLFVDEGFASTSRAAREGSFSATMWRPLVRFNSRHYKFSRDKNGPVVLQVGVAADKESEPGFGRPAVAKQGAPPSA